MGETSSCSTSISTTNILKSGTWWVLFCSKDGRLLLFTRGVSNPTCVFFWRWKTRLPAFLGFFQGTTREVLMYWCCKFYEDITTWESHRSWLQQFLGLAWPFGQVRKGMLYGITFPWTGESEGRSFKKIADCSWFVLAVLAIVQFFWFTLRSNLNPGFLWVFFEAGGTSFNWKLWQQKPYIYVYRYRYIYN